MNVFLASCFSAFGIIILTYEPEIILNNDHKPDYVFASNDTPLGVWMADHGRPENVTALHWNPLNHLSYSTPGSHGSIVSILWIIKYWSYIQAYVCFCCSLTFLLNDVRESTNSGRYVFGGHCFLSGILIIALMIVGAVLDSHDLVIMLYGLGHANLIICVLLLNYYEL